MAFAARTYEEIRDDMIAYVRMQTDLTDFEVGSVVRTIIEAAALEDDEQYFQMVQLLDAFRLSTAAAKDLDDRVAEYGVIRLQPESSTGTVVFHNTLLPTSTLKYNAVLGASSLVLNDSSAFPASSFTVRVGEGTTSVEDIAVTSNNTSTGTLSLSTTLTKSHNAGDRTSHVPSGSDTTISSGVRVQVPPQGGQLALTFVTTEIGTLVNGNYASTPVTARAESPGSDGNVGTDEITEFVSALPFTGASVTNITATAGGRNLETDAQLRDRARGQLQSLSKATKLALQQAAIGVADAVTGQRVVTATVVESFVDNEVRVYIDDGTGFTPDKVIMPYTTLATAPSSGNTSIVVEDASEFPIAGCLVIDADTPAVTEVVLYEDVNYTTNTITLSAPLGNSHLINMSVQLADSIEDSAEEGANYFQLSNFPVVRNSYFVYVVSDGVTTRLVEGDDYFLNRGTGQLELLGAGVSAGAKIVAHYSYYTALVKKVQSVIDGDPANPTTFPGVRAAGILVSVETPSIRRINVHVAVTAQAGTQEADIIPNVQEAIETYISSLGIGEDVIKSEIIRRAMNVSGVLDVSVVLPTTNIVVLENELARAVDTAGNSLVLVN